MYQFIDIHTESSEDLNRFDELPDLLYEKGSMRFRQHDAIKHPFLVSLKVILRGDKPVGRYALYINPHMDIEGRKSACIGLYECEESAETATCLLEDAKSIACQLGAEELIGPMNGSTWDNYRFSENHAPPYFFLEPYHHLYYNKHFLEAGFLPLGRYVSQMDTALTTLSDSDHHWRNGLTDKGIIIRNIIPERYTEEVELLYDFLSSTFRENFLYTPVSKEYFLNKYLPLKKFLDPEFVKMAFSPEGNVVGLVFAIPDLYSIEGKGVIIKTVARMPNRIYAGLTHVMVDEIIQQALAKGYSYIIHAFMHQQNISRNLSRRYSGVPFKSYVLYRVHL